jgi:4'-phosphopantetheinyl transferase EntD
MNIKTLDIPFFLDGKKEKCALSIADGANFRLEDFKGYLSEIELKKLSSAGIDKRKIEFGLGRITTKTALSSFQRIVFGEVNIINEKFGRPIIEGSDYSTTITHTNKIVASLVFRNEFSFGIDIEGLRENSMDALRYVVFERERIPDNLECLTAAWTLKESLVKALKLNFYLSLDELELSNFCGYKDFFTCSYVRRPEFNGIALIYGDRMYAAAYRSNIRFPETTAASVRDFLR